MHADGGDCGLWGEDGSDGEMRVRLLLTECGARARIARGWRGEVGVLDMMRASLAVWTRIMEVGPDAIV